MHAYERDTGSHNPPGCDGACDADSDYVRQLDAVRVFHAADVAQDATLSASWSALGECLRANDVHSLLDAPVRGEGELLGVVCHEQVGHARSWTRKDEVFIASIGKLHRSFVVAARRTPRPRHRPCDRSMPR